jgi:hypothetical protein
MDVSVNLPKAFVAAAAVAVLLALLLLAWIGGELHYRSCVADAEARNPVVYFSTGTTGSVGSEYVRAPDEAPRSEAIDGCSRWP